MRQPLMWLCISVTFFSLLSAFWLQGKSMVGQVLLDRAWYNTVVNKEMNKAWPWADTWPVAKLTVRKSGKSLIVLDGVSGEAMAFGPGKIHGSSTTSSSGIFAIGGHRDSHLAFLEHLEGDDVIELQTQDGVFTSFEVTEQYVANSENESLALPTDVHALVMITCYPFNAFQTGGPLRYVVVARPVSSSDLISY